MGFTKDSAAAAAKRDLARRLNVEESEVDVSSTSDSDFPDMSLGAAEKGEMSGQMISSGWTINLKAGGKSYEYRASRDQLRAKDFQGKNYKIG